MTAMIFTGVTFSSCSGSSEFLPESSSSPAFFSSEFSMIRSTSDTEYPSGGVSLMYFATAINPTVVPYWRYVFAGFHRSLITPNWAFQFRYI